jgi:hypothetical protein
VGQHPAGNSYPTAAWRPGEVVPDFHALPLPLLDRPRELALQVALAPPFTPPAALAWHDVTTLVVDPAGQLWRGRPVRAQLGPMLLAEVGAPAQIRPAADASVAVRGYGVKPERLALTLASAAQGIEPSDTPPVGQTGSSPYFAAGRVLDTDQPAGRYGLVASVPDATAVCGWLRHPSAGCVVADIEISGSALPAGATNFGDQIALVAVDLPNTTLVPGGELAVNLTWQALAEMTEDYTAFVQVLDGADRIAGQLDSWPLQGTFPTSQWQPGQVVDDPYLIRLQPDLSPGPYRLHVGWYLLRTQQRLQVLDDSGAAVDDKVEVPGLLVPDA